MPKTGGITWRLQDVCFRGSFTKLWRPRTRLPLAPQPCAKGPSPSPAPSLSSLGTSFSVSPLLRTPHCHPAPNTQAIPFFHSFPSCQWLSLHLLLLLFFLPSRLTTAPAPLLLCQGLCSIPDPSRSMGHLFSPELRATVISKILQWYW